MWPYVDLYICVYFHVGLRHRKVGVFLHFKVLGEEKKFVFAEQRRLMLCSWMECDSSTGDSDHYLLDPVLIATAAKSEIRQLPPVLDCHFWKFILYISPCKVSYCSPEWVLNQVCAYCGVNKHTQLVPPRGGL